MNHIVYLGLGSNLEQPQQQIQQACNAIAMLPDTRLLLCSPLYRSAPLGPAGQPDYINAALSIETQLEPETLLDSLQAIENQQGRVRKQRWGARTLDIDILLYGNKTIDSPRLTIPHSQIALRNFVLLPLQDINPDLHFPDGSSLATLVARCGTMGIERLAPNNNKISNCSINPSAPN